MNILLGLTLTAFGAAAMIIGLKTLKNNPAIIGLTVYLLGIAIVMTLMGLVATFGGFQ